MQLLHGVQLEAQQSVLEGNSFAGDVRDTVQHQVLLPLVVVKYPFIIEMFLLDPLAATGIWLA
jgi:hypothetical protein